MSIVVSCTYVSINENHSVIGASPKMSGNTCDYWNSLINVRAVDQRSRGTSRELL